MPNWEQNETELELRVGKCYIGYREADETSVFLTMLRVSGVFSLSPCVCVCVQCHLTLQRMETISRGIQ